MYLKRRQYSDPVGRIQSQRYSDICPEVEPIDSSVAYTAKRIYATIDCPIRKRKADDILQLSAAQAVIEIRIHIQPIMVEQKLGH